MMPKGPERTTPPLRGYCGATFVHIEYSFREKVTLSSPLLVALVFPLLSMKVVVRPVGVSSRATLVGVILPIQSLCHGSRPHGVFKAARPHIGSLCRGQVRRRWTPQDGWITPSYPYLINARLCMKPRRCMYCDCSRCITVSWKVTLIITILKKYKDNNLIR